MDTDVSEFRSRKYKTIRISGPITVERTEEVQHLADNRQLVLILGPTGAGKSTFIEVLANDSTLHISSNQLEGFTQSVSAYQIHNVTCVRSVIYLVDVPGFADTKVSAMSIVSMLKEWMQKNRVEYFTQLLYFTPINVVRLPGSQREVVRTFRALTGIKTAEMTIIVSTMWDSIWSDNARERAERNLNQLQEDIWKANLDGGSRIVKFMNTRESALSVLDAAFENSSLAYMNVEDFVRHSQNIHETPFGIHLYEDLQSRISGLQLQRYNIQSEVQVASGSLDERLLTTLGRQLEQVDILLAKFEGEMERFGPPPGPNSSTGRPIPPASPVPPSPSILTPVASSVPGGTHADDPTDAVAQTKRGIFTQVLGAMKCWRKAN